VRVPGPPAGSASNAYTAFYLGSVVTRYILPLAGMGPANCSIPACATFLVDPSTSNSMNGCARAVSNVCNTPC
jgi:hypothetical protein